MDLEPSLTAPIVISHQLDGSEQLNEWSRGSARRRWPPLDKPSIMLMNDVATSGSKTNNVMVHQDPVFASVKANRCRKFPIKTETNVECNLMKYKR